MKITFDEKDIPLLLAQANENTFMMAAMKGQAANSLEGFGLPSFKKLTFKTESEIWKDERVKAAIVKVREYAKKKDYTIATPQQAQSMKAALFTSLAVPDAMAKGLVATLKQPKFVKMGDVTILACQATFKQASRVNATSNANVAAGVAGGAAIPYGNVMGGAKAGVGAMLKNKGFDAVMNSAQVGAALGGFGAFLGVYVITNALTYGLSKLIFWLTNVKKYGYYDSYIPFINKKGKLVWTEFGRFLVGDIKADELKVETVESYKVDMEAFSTENCNECDEIDVVVVETPDEEDIAIVESENNIGIDLSNAEDEPPTTEVILDSSDADGSETPVKDADEQQPAVEEVKMDEETAESFEALTRNSDSFLDDEFVFV